MSTRIQATLCKHEYKSLYLHVRTHFLNLRVKLFRRTEEYLMVKTKLNPEDSIIASQSLDEVKEGGFRAFQAYRLTSLKKFENLTYLVLTSAIPKKSMSTFRASAIVSLYQEAAG